MREGRRKTERKRDYARMERALDGGVHNEGMG